MSTGTELADLCEKRFRDESNVIHSAAHWLTLLSQAQYDMLTEARTPVEETTSTLNFAAGDQSKALASGVYAVRTVRDSTNETVLNPIHSRRVFDELYVDPTERGVPIHYHLIGGNLHLRPTTDRAIAVVVTHHAPAVDITGGTSPIIPVMFHRNLVDGALATAFYDDHQLDLADRYSARFNKAVERYRTWVSRERLGRHTPVSKRFSMWT